MQQQQRWSVWDWRRQGLPEPAWGSGTSSEKMIEAVARQPESGSRVGKYMWIGFALVKAIALYRLVITFIIMGLRK